MARPQILRHDIGCPTAVTVGCVSGVILGLGVRYFYAEGINMEQEAPLVNSKSNGGSVEGDTSKKESSTSSITATSDASGIDLRSIINPCEFNRLSLIACGGAECSTIVASSGPNGCLLTWVLERFLHRIDSHWN